MDPSLDPARPLERRAVLALTLVGILSICSALLFVAAQRTTADDAPVITVAGRERMLTQKLTNLVLEIQVAAERKQFAFLTGELRSNFEAWAGAHQALQSGDPELGLAPNESPEIAQEFAQIEPDWVAIRDATQHLLGATTVTSPEAAYDDISKQVLTILEHGEPFADGMDRIAAVYLSQAQAHVRQTQRVVWFLTGVIVLVLILEGLLVFRPAVRLIRRQFLEQRELAEEARTLAMVARRTDNGVVIADAEGRIEWVNDAFVRMTGWNLEELKGQVPRMLLDGADISAEKLADLSRHLAGGQPIRLELVHQRRDGRFYWGDIECVPVTDEHGAVVQYIGIERDVTDRKRADEEIRRHTTEVEASRDRLRAQAIELEKVSRELALARDQALASARAKSEFLANMSHEIRTPMNGVIGMTALLLDTDLTEEQRDYALTVRHSADALLTVINDILDFSKIEAGKLTLEHVDFNLRTVLEEVGDLLAPRAHEKSLEFACVLPPEAPDAFRGDPARLRQMLINLVGNAIKFTEAGEVAVEAQVTEHEPGRATVRITVRDTGIGISKERHAAIFESFTQADGSTTRRYGGTGLGLTISRQLVDLMGGRIGLESELGTRQHLLDRDPLRADRGGARGSHEHRDAGGSSRPGGRRPRHQPALAPRTAPRLGHAPRRGVERTRGARAPAHRGRGRPVRDRAPRPADAGHGRRCDGGGDQGRSAHRGRAVGAALVGRRAPRRGVACQGIRRRPGQAGPRDAALPHAGGGPGCRRAGEGTRAGADRYGRGGTDGAPGAAGRGQSGQPEGGAPAAREVGLPGRLRRRRRARRWPPGRTPPSTPC